MGSKALMHCDTPGSILAALDDDDKEHSFLCAAVLLNAANTTVSKDFVKTLNAFVKRFDDSGNGIMPPVPLAVLMLRATE